MATILTAWPCAAPRGQRGGRAHVHPVGDRVAGGPRDRLGIEGDHLGGRVTGAEALDPSLPRRRAAVDVDILAGIGVRIGGNAFGQAGERAAGVDFGGAVGSL